MEHLKNLNIVITAGASGIGSAMAIELSKHGSCVTICDKDSSALDSFSKNNPKIDCHNVDVSEEQQIKKFFNEIEKKVGNINALINNAGFQVHQQNLKILVSKIGKRLLIQILMEFF